MGWRLDDELRAVHTAYVHIPNALSVAAYNLFPQLIRSCASIWQDNASGRPTSDAEQGDAGNHSNGHMQTSMKQLQIGAIMGQFLPIVAQETLWVAF